MASDLSNADLEKMPPIEQKRTEAFVNHFLIETINCLNKVAETCEEKMEEICSQMDRMETMLSILEDKLASIPGVNLSKEPETGEGVAPREPVLTSTPNASQTSEEAPQTQQLPRKADEVPSTETVDSEPQQEAKPVTIDPQVMKFFKMVQFGVPAQAVKLKMAAEGFDPALLDAGPAAAPAAPQPASVPKRPPSESGSSSDVESASSFSD